MTLPVALLVELTKNLLREALAQLNTPLVEAVDVPNSTLSECQVLVVDNQSTQLGGTDSTTNKDGSGRAVTEEALVRNQLIGSTLSLHLLVSLADHEGLSLGEVVGCKHLLVQVVGDGVVGLRGEDEIGGDQLGALVDKLEERVLGISAGLAEQYRTYLTVLAKATLLCTR